MLVLLTIHLAWLVATAQGHVPACWPWLDGCTSISATGRQLPEKLFFKPLMIIAVLAMAATWWITARWLAAAGCDRPRLLRMLAWAGIAGSLCSVVYLAALGEGGGSARVLRRLGASLGFAGLFLAELLTVVALARLAARPALPAWWSPGLYRLLWALVLLVFGLGILSAVLAATWPRYAAVEDAFEWQFALWMNLWLPVLALLWRRAGVTMQLRVA